MNFIFPYIGNNHPNSLILFREVETTNHIYVYIYVCSYLCIYIYISICIYLFTVNQIFFHGIFRSNPLALKNVVLKMTLLGGWGFRWSDCVGRSPGMGDLITRLTYSYILGLKHYLSIHLGTILPNDFHIFQRGWNHQPVYKWDSSPSCVHLTSDGYITFMNDKFEGTYTPFPTHQYPRYSYHSIWNPTPLKCLETTGWVKVAKSISDYLPVNIPKNIDGTPMGFTFRNGLIPWWIFHIYVGSLGGIPWNQSQLILVSSEYRIEDSRISSLTLFSKKYKSNPSSKTRQKKHLPLLYYVCVMFMLFFLSNSRSCFVYPAERRLLMSVTRSQAEEATGGGVGGDICRSVGDHGNIMGIWWEYLGIWWKPDGNLWACCFWWGYRRGKFSYPGDIWWETKSMVIQKIYLDLHWFCLVSQREFHYGECASLLRGVCTPS